MGVCKKFEEVDDGSDDGWSEVEVGIGRVVIPPLRFSVVKWPDWMMRG